MSFGVYGVDPQPAKTPPAPLVRGGAKFEWWRAYDAAPGTPLRGALKAAFTSTKDDDDESEMELVLYAYEAASGRAVELGAHRLVSLELR